MEIIPVIHLISIEQARANIETCLLSDIKKVFLIGHGSNSVPGKITHIFQLLKADYPEMWYGVNYLTLPNDEALQEVTKYGYDGIWTDNADLSKERIIHADFFLHRKPASVTYFGGVEFKYQIPPKPEYLDEMYKHAVNLIDVITTSGPGTGLEISLNKLSRIRKSIGEHPLAVASGVNKSNIKNISEYANYALVASSITNYQDELIVSDKLKELMNEVS